jgi:hypothetical protein
MFLYLSRHLHMFHDCHRHCPHEVYLFSAQGKSDSVIDDEKASNWDPSLGYQWYSGVELEEWIPGNEWQGIEALILAQVLDNKT